MKIDHAAMYVNNLETVKDFFIIFFNGKAGNMYHNEKTGFRSYFITFDDGARLEIMNRPDMRDEEKYPYRTGLIHLAFSVGSKEKVDELTETHTKKGYPVQSGPRTTGDGYYESCILGPEGNMIEITV